MGKPWVNHNPSAGHSCVSSPIDKHWLELSNTRNIHCTGTMYHGTSSRFAQLIVAGQRFRRSKKTSSSMFGEGVYVTRDKWKAEGYRTHHPNTAVGAAANPLLQSGEPDPGCILEFRARIGVCKEFTRDGPGPSHSSYFSWHDDEVPESMRTTSMERAVTAAHLPELTYNSAFTAGCSCCKDHGAGCPGSPEKGHHHQPPGQDPCKGRCETGNRCKTANSSREEFCIWNPSRIDRIKIVEGPKDLIGYGEQLWDADPQTLRAEHAKVQRLQNEERDLAEATAMAAYKKYAEAAQQLAPVLKQAALLSAHRSIGFQHQELTQACSKKRLLMEMIGGTAVEVTVPPELGDKYQRFGGTFTMITESADSDRKIDEEIVFANIIRRQITLRTFGYPFYHPLHGQHAGWWLIDEGYVGPGFYLVLEERYCGGSTAIPFLGTNPWRDKDFTVKCQIAVARLSADDLAARIAAESERALAAARKQFDQFGTFYDKCAGFVLKGHPADAHPASDAPEVFDGLYRLVANDLNGWPHLVNHCGVHCFRHQPLAAWIFSHQTNLGELPNITPSDRQLSRGPSKSREALFEVMDECRKMKTAEDYVLYVLESTDLSAILPIGNDLHVMPMRAGERVESIPGDFQVSLELISDSKARSESTRPPADVEDLSAAANAAARYKCVKRSQVSAGFEMDSDKAGTVVVGDVIAVIEARVNENGVLRVCFDGGWVSEKTSAGELCLEPMAASAGFHMRMLGHHIASEETSSCWQQALAANDETHKRAVCCATGRVLWHLLQPAMCTALYLANTAEVSSLQNALVVTLQVRCYICFVEIATCIRIVPAFFRVDVMASLRASDYIEDYGEILGGTGFVAMFLLANDKLLAVAVSKQLKTLSRKFPSRTCACGRLPFWDTVRYLAGSYGAASAWLEVCSVAALGLALGASLSSNADHGLPGSLIVAHCVSAISLCCTVVALVIKGNTIEWDRPIAGAMGVFSVAMASLCLAFPLEMWSYVVVGPMLVFLTFGLAVETLPDNDESGTWAAGVGCGGIAVCALFVLIGAGIMFEPDGADGNCTAYYDGFQYLECNSTLLETTASSYAAEEGAEGSSSINASTSSSSSWGGE